VTNQKASSSPDQPLNGQKKITHRARVCCRMRARPLRMSKPVPSRCFEAPSRDVRVACTGSRMTRESNGPQTWVGSDDLLTPLTKIRYGSKAGMTAVETDDWALKLGSLTSRSTPFRHHKTPSDDQRLFSSYDYDHDIVCSHIYFETWKLATLASTSHAAQRQETLA
jgi:hypothetical protein